MKVEIYHEGCLQWLRDQPDNCVAAVITDPPYWKQGDEDLSPFLNDVLRECLRVAKGPVIIVGPIDWPNNPAAQPRDITLHASQQQPWFPKPDGFGVWHTIMRPPPNFQPMRGVAAVRIWRGADLGQWEIELESDVSAAGGRSGRKPPMLFRRLLNYVQYRGTILDPFMGSGSVCDACAHKGYDFIGIENDRATFEEVRKRILPESKEIKTTRDGSPGSYATGSVTIKVA